MVNDLKARSRIDDLLSLSAVVLLYIHKSIGKLYADFSLLEPNRWQSHVTM
jgi:hypothetical protein